MIQRPMIGMVMLRAIHETAPAHHQGWQHSGALYTIATREGANLPPTASEYNFPLLVRLNSGN